MDDALNGEKRWHCAVARGSSRKNNLFIMGCYYVRFKASAHSEAGDSDESLRITDVS